MVEPMARWEDLDGTDRRAVLAALGAVLSNLTEHHRSNIDPYHWALWLRQLRVYPGEWLDDMFPYAKCDWDWSKVTEIIYRDEAGSRDYADL